MNSLLILHCILYKTLFYFLEKCCIFLAVFTSTNLMAQLSYTMSVINHKKKCRPVLYYQSRTAQGNDGVFIRYADKGWTCFSSIAAPSIHSIFSPFSEQRRLCVRKVLLFSLPPYFPQFSLLSLLPPLFTFPPLTPLNPLISYSLPLPPLADSKPIFRNLEYQIRFSSRRPFRNISMSRWHLLKRVSSTNNLSRILFLNLNATFWKRLWISGM